jgi:type IV fimbrial biogenesis protein FimT
MIRRRVRTAGFTIIELLTAVAIAAILVAIAAPSFAEFLAKRRVEGVMSELITDFQYTRSEAVRRNETVRMTFGAGCYVIHAVSVSANTTDCSLSGSDIKTVQIDSSRLLLKPEGSLTYVEFEPVRGTVAKDPPSAGSARVDVCVPNAARTDCGSSATAWRLRAVVSPPGRVEACSPTGSGHVSGYSSNCS